MADDSIRSISSEGVLVEWNKIEWTWTANHTDSNKRSYGWFTDKNREYVIQVLTKSWNYRIIESDEEWEWLKIN
jgi:hypothetical protein